MNNYHQALQPEVDVLLGNMKSLCDLLEYLEEKTVGCCGFYGPWDCSLTILIRPCSTGFQSAFLDDYLDGFNGNNEMDAVVRRLRDEVYVALRPYPVYMQVVMCIVEHIQTTERLWTVQSRNVDAAVPFTLSLANVIKTLRGLIGYTWSIDAYSRFNSIMSNMGYSGYVDTVERASVADVPVFTRAKDVLVALQARNFDRVTTLKDLIT